MVNPITTTRLSMESMARNLSQMKNAITRSQQNPPDWKKNLYSNHQGTELLGGGRTLEIIYCRSMVAGKYHLKMSAGRDAVLYKTMRRTYRAFVYYLNKLTPPDGSSPSDSYVCSWITWVTPTLRDVVFPYLETVKEAFGVAFSKSKSHQDDYNPAIFEECYPLYKHYRRWRHFIDLRNDHSFPETTLKILADQKLGKGGTLSDTDEEELKAWINRINSSIFVLKGWKQWLAPPRLNCRNFHKALDVFLKKYNPDFETTSLVELELIKRGLNILRYPDARQMVKRQKWLEEGKIPFEEDFLILGEQVSSKKLLAKDKRVIYTLKNDPTKVVVLYWNRALPMLNFRQWFEEKEKGLQPQMTGIHIGLSNPEEGWLVMDRLALPLTLYPWGDLLSSSDILPLNALVSYVNWLIDQVLTPVNIHANDLGWMIEEPFEITKATPLMTTKFQEMKPLNFLTLLTLVNEIGGDSSWVASYIISKSKLEKCPEFLYFKDVIASTAAWEDKSCMEILTGKLRDETVLKDKRLVKAAEAFREKLKLVMEETLLYICSQYEISANDALKSQIGKRILAFYEESLVVTQIPDTLKETITEKLLTTGLYRLKAPSAGKKLNAIKAASEENPALLKDNHYLNSLGIYHPAQIQEMRMELVKKE